MIPQLPDNDLPLTREVPRPDAAFAAQLRQKLIAAHPANALPIHRRRWQWVLSVPAVAVVVLFTLLTTTFGPALSPEQFLERAHAAARELMARGKIEYTKRRQLFVLEQNPYVGPLAGESYAPANEPLIWEEWFLWKEDGTSIIRDRRSKDDGTLLHERITRSSDPDMLVWDAQWLRIPKEDRARTPVCVHGLFADEPFEPFTEEEQEAMSEAAIGGSDEGTQLYVDLQDRDPAVRTNALLKLQRLGQLKDLGTATASGRTLRTFRMPLATTSFDDEGNALVNPDGMALLLSFDTADYMLRVEERRDVKPDGSLGGLLDRTEYLERAYVDEPAERVFDPQRYGLVDPWTLLPSPRADYESGKAQQGCYMNGRYLGADVLVLLESELDELQDAYSRQVVVQFDNRPLHPWRQGSSSSVAR